MHELHEADGTMRVQLESGNCEIEVPLTHAAVGERVGIAIRAGDIMLGYQSTSFHDALYLRQIFGLRPAPEFEAWFEGVQRELPRMAGALLGA